MKIKSRRLLFIHLPLIVLTLALNVGIMLLAGGPLVRAQEEGSYFISGILLDNQGQSIPEARVTLEIEAESEAIAETESQEDGGWILELDSEPPVGMIVHISRPHFSEKSHLITGEQRQDLITTQTLSVGEIILDRAITPAFWAATIIFAAVLLLIAFEILHSTTAALLGISLVFLVSFFGAAVAEPFFIMSFERALTYINWEVIFLVMGMMIIIAVIEGTGIFQWTAFQAFKWSGGRGWLLVLILIALTAVASALLDNFTTMLLMTPISIQIGLAMGINPLALIIPEVMASNVGGISTLIGTPTNILIGAHAGISFTDFLQNQTVGVILALIALSLFVLLYFRKELRGDGREISPTLYEKLEERSRIKEPGILWKSGIVFIFVIIGFVIGERYHVVPAVPALIGATALLLWTKPDIHEMIRAVDWTTMVFFIALFMVVGAVQEVGMISLIAEKMAQIVGESLPLGLFIMVIGVGTLSTVIANIPLAASMLPVVDFLSASIPGAATSKALYYGLSMGAAMGGNATLVGAEANLVTVGITEQAGYSISFKEFLKVGLPVTYITLIVGFLWLLIKFA